MWFVVLVLVVVQMAGFACYATSAGVHGGALPLQSPALALHSTAMHKCWAKTDQNINMVQCSAKSKYGAVHHIYTLHCSAECKYGPVQCRVLAIPLHLSPSHFLTSLTSLYGVLGTS